MKVSLIAAVARNGTIGKDNDLPWTIKDDMRFFVDKTRGHCVIMGRRNFDAMGRPLPKRTNIVVTRNADLTLDGAIVVNSIEDALRHAARTGEEEAFVIGGAEIYRLALPHAHAFYRTRVLADVEGDVKFPEICEEDWEVSRLSEGEENERNEYAFVIEELTRKRPPQAF
jgi:dihydrofolate reductase